MKLWSKANTEITASIEKFTVGKDRDFDIVLAEYDVLGSLAHAQMLRSIGLLSESELRGIHTELNNILTEIRRGNFKIDEDVEDIHSQIELLLTKRLGDAGKKIHSGRSRNDQVAVAIKLFLKESVLGLKDQVKNLFELLIAQSEKFKKHLLPGYTHFQVAMPSSFGLWFAAYAESLVDDLEQLVTAYHIANKNPLGSGAGYGSSFPLDRMLTTTLLNFETMNYNVVYAQMSRGKAEKAVASALASIAATLSKLAVDVCVYINQNFGFISFPAGLTTGSSIMPHKKNPDVFELIRARCNRIQSIPNEITLLINNLPSGYHRDFQLSKEILFPALEEIRSNIEMAMLMLSNIIINENILDDEKYKYLFTVEAVNELVTKGMPFREAYQKIGNEIESGEFSFDYKKQLHHTHEGSIGNLSNDKIVREMEKVLAKFK